MHPHSFPAFTIAAALASAHHEIEALQALFESQRDAFASRLAHFAANHDDPEGKPGREEARRARAARLAQRSQERAVAAGRRTAAERERLGSGVATLGAEGDLTRSLATLGDFDSTLTARSGGLVVAGEERGGRLNAYLC